MAGIDVLARRPAPHPRSFVRAAGLLAIWLLLLVFIVYPLAMLLLRAFLSDGGLTLDALLAALKSTSNLRALRNSLLLALLVGVAGTIFGLAFALALERANLGPRTARLIDGLTFLPLISPPFTTSIAFVFSFGPRGLLTYDLLGINNAQMYGLTSTFAAETLTYFPIAYLALRPMLASINSSFEEASFSLGGSRWHAFRTVTIPLIIPALANAFLLLFGCSLADFATPLILAGSDFSVLPTEAYLQITGMFDLKSGAILSLLLLLPAGLVFYAQERVVAGRSYVTVTGKASAASRRDTLSTAAKIALLTFCVLTVALILYFYALLFAASIVQAFGANHTVTLDHYRVIFTEGLPAIKDTLIVAIIGMPLGGLYGIVVGYLIGRTKFVGRRAMEVVTMLNYALPGTIVGIAYLLAFNDKPLALTGTATILIACYVFRYSPTGIRTTVALLQQIDKSMEEASASLGASDLVTFRRVMLPLILPAFFAGLGVVFIRSMTAISATIFLVSIDWTLITVKILENMTEVALGPAAAFSVFVIVVVVVVTGLLNVALRHMTAPSCALAELERDVMAKPLEIGLRGVSATFHHESRGDIIAVKDLDLTVRPGEFLTLLGASGCGKTTTLRMVAGFQQPSAGEILFDGANVTNIPANQRDIGFVFQNYALFPHLSVFENVAYGLRIKRQNADEIEVGVERGLRQVGLQGLGGRMISELSGGQQQRVALARAIAIKPRVLLFDEPLSNLDAKLRVQMRSEISRLQKELAITTVYVTHDQEEAMAISDRIAIMNDGRIVQIGRAEELYQKPASRFVAGFLGNTNLVRGTVLAVDAGRVTLDVAGHRWTVATNTTTTVGSVVEAVVRPEAVALSRGDGVLPGIVEGRVFLGDKAEYRIRAAELEFLVVQWNPTAGELFMIGETCALTLPASGVQLLSDSDESA